MPVGPGGHGGSEDRRVPPSGGAGGGLQPGPRRHRGRSALRTLHGTGRVIPFRRPNQARAPEGLAPRQSRVLVGALAAVMAAVLVVTAVVLRPELGAPRSNIRLVTAQFHVDQPQLVRFASYPNVLPVLGTGVYVVRLASGWLAFADLPPDQPARAASTKCTLAWSTQTSRFEDPCTGAAWRIDGTPARGGVGGPQQAHLPAFAVTAQGRFININVGALAP